MKVKYTLLTAQKVDIAKTALVVLGSFVLGWNLDTIINKIKK